MGTREKRIRKGRRKEIEKIEKIEGWTIYVNVSFYSTKQKLGPSYLRNQR
jgi:hypothetical protein